ncbi:MAG: PEP-CTERM sorting domain-containing protein [Candidatus Brocadiales bacterium]|nr:PEP-CTERM sorting domain-containing protein [Candidatus Bathyanammoxibius sp.]
MKRLISPSMCMVMMFVCVSVAEAKHGGGFQTEMVSMQLTGDVGGIPIEIRESPNLPSPGDNVIITNGVFVVDSFFDVFFEISVDGGPFEPQTNLDTMITRLTKTSNGAATGSWDTEMVSMSLTGDVGGIPIEIRATPATLPSPGETKLTDLGGGEFQIDSFFDVFTEISVDGGPWQPQANPGTVVTTLITPEPTSMALMVIGLLALALSRRKRWR